MECLCIFAVEKRNTNKHVVNSAVVAAVAADTVLVLRRIWRMLVSMRVWRALVLMRVWRVLVLMQVWRRGCSSWWRSWLFHSTAAEAGVGQLCRAGVKPSVFDSPGFFWSPML